jgi:hypothetical protein
VGNWPSFAYNHAPRFSDYVTTLLLDMGLVTACPGRTENEGSQAVYCLEYVKTATRPVGTV